MHRLIGHAIVSADDRIADAERPHARSAPQRGGLGTVPGRARPGGADAHRAGEPRGDAESQEAQAAHRIGQRQRPGAARRRAVAQSRRTCRSPKRSTASCRTAGRWRSSAGRVSSSLSAPPASPPSIWRGRAACGYPAAAGCSQHASTACRPHRSFRRGGLVADDDVLLDPEAEVTLTLWRRPGEPSPGRSGGTIRKGAQLFLRQLRGRLARQPSPPRRRPANGRKAPAP